MHWPEWNFSRTQCVAWKTELSKPLPSRLLSAYWPEDRAARRIATMLIQLSWCQESISFSFADTFVTFWICRSWAKAKSFFWCFSAASWIKKDEPYLLVTYCYIRKDLETSVCLRLPSFYGLAPVLLSMHCSAGFSGVVAPPSVHLCLLVRPDVAPVNPVAAASSGPTSSPEFPLWSCILPVHPAAERDTPKRAGIVWRLLNR